MSFQVGPVCYPTELAAAQAQASATVGTVINHGTTAYVVDSGTIAGNSITYLLHPFGGGPPVSLAAPFTPQPCNLLQWSDGLQLGWLVAAVWLGVYAVIFIAKALKGMEPEQNDA